MPNDDQYKKKFYVAAGKEKKPFLALLAQFIQVLRQYYISETPVPVGWY